MTGIEWCRNPDGSNGMSWNPISGCSWASPGCDNCYARRMSQRLKGRCGYPMDDPFRVSFHSDKLRKAFPKKPSRIFVCSMSDLYHDLVQDWYIDAMFDRMVGHPQHNFIILTKRPKRLLKWSQSSRGRRWYISHPHIWFGVTCENQAMANLRIPLLLQVQCEGTRFVSFEPGLGPIDFERIKWWQNEDHYVDVLRRGFWHPTMGFISHSDMNGIGWIIAGGETGPKARPLHPDWVRNIKDVCQDAGIPFFFKSWGEWRCVYDRDKEDPDWRNCPRTKNDNGRYLNIVGSYGFHNERVIFVKRIGKKAAGRLIDGRTWDEMPEVKKR